MKNSDQAIGFFDSGVGGISVLKQALKLMPEEDYIYYGDSLNAPYGTKNVEEVKKLTFKAADFLIKKDVKAIVIACNTATSAAINDLRKTYKDMPVIGIEPALKPAVELKREGKILIMATPMTLSEKKFNNLMNNYNKEADIVPLPCPGLVELIENGIVEGRELKEYFNNILSEFKREEIGVVVLGCTHYPFVKKELSNSLIEGTPIIDGSLGTAKQLKKQLIKRNLYGNEKRKGKVTVFNSLQNSNSLELCYKLLNIE